MPTFIRRYFKLFKVGDLVSFDDRNWNLAIFLGFKTFDECDCLDCKKMTKDKSCIQIFLINENRETWIYKSRARLQ